MTDRSNHADIRIGTLVKGGGDPADYIIQISQHGFESYSITFWQTLGGKDLSAMAEQVKAACADSGAVISSICPFGNPLGTRPEDEELRSAWEQCIDHAADFGCDIVAGFAGGTGGSVAESIDRYKEVFEPLADRAGEKGVRLAFENCAMGGTWKKTTTNIALGPKCWDLMFEALPNHSNIGLQWEPCHQLVMLADPMPQLRHYADRIFHVHGKDASVYHDVIAEQGISGGPEKFAHHRHPGFGDSDWTAIISRLRLNGFTGCIDIEGWHDPVYKGDLEMTGQVHALNYLKQCRGGSYATNPQQPA